MDRLISIDLIAVNTLMLSAWFYASQWFSVVVVDMDLRRGHRSQTWINESGRYRSMDHSSYHRFS